MPFNFYDTHTLLLAVQGLTPAPSFLRDRYFPTNDATDLFATTDVLAEYRDGTNRLAPFVAPRIGLPLSDDLFPRCPWHRRGLALSARQFPFVGLP